MTAARSGLLDDRRIDLNFRYVFQYAARGAKRRRRCRSYEE
jgi:hypothetical protein